MTIKETESAVAAAASGASYSLAQDFTISGTTNPAYLVVTVLDRNEYTAAATGVLGTLSGAGATLALTGQGQDARGAGIVYTWQSATDQYVNATYGTFAQLSYTASTSPYDITNVSLFTTTSASLAQNDASSTYAMMQADPGGYAGSVTFSSDPGFTATIPAQATPASIAAIASSFVGDAWNENGCWVLASTIAAEAGAGLPVQSAVIGAGQNLGEWTVVFNGPAGATGNWQNLVSAGDVIGFVPAGGGGHITTCVSGSGSTAMLVDNITYQGRNGAIQNSANDGSANDVLISAPHLASQEFSGASARNVVIYALDTPVVSLIPAVPANAANNASMTLGVGTTTLLSKFVTAADPAHKSITQYQIYDTGGTDSLLTGTTAVTATSAATCVTVKTLASISIAAGTAATTDTLEIRAFNGTYWGDWAALPVNVVMLPPTVAVKTAGQSWLQGKVINFALPATTFKDPQGQALTYTATQTGGAALPSWLTFTPATRNFSGTVPAGIAQFSIAVTATDTAGLSATETFAINTPAAAPTVTDKAAAQTWAEGSSVNFALPTDSFTDPQGQALTLKATLSSGAALPSWLSFNSATMTFSGTAPAKAQTIALKITATDTSNLSISETFNAAIAAAAAGAVFAANDWAGGFTLRPEASASAAAPLHGGGSQHLPAAALAAGAHFHAGMGHGLFHL